MTRQGGLQGFLEELLRQRGLKPSQLAAYVGVSQPSVSRWLRGEDMPSPLSCERLALFAGTAPTQVLRMAGHLSSAVAEGKPRYETARLRSLNEVLAEVQAVAPVAVPVFDRWSDAEEGRQARGHLYINRAEARERELVAVRLRDEAMAPEVQPGDIAVVERGISPRPGQMAALIVGSELMVRRRGASRGGGVLFAASGKQPAPLAPDQRVVGVVRLILREWW